MKINRRRGATLGLVAVCVLVVIVLGIGFFVLSKIVGGGREVSNATDAGVLTVARMALSPTRVAVAINSVSHPRAGDFSGLDPEIAVGNTAVGVGQMTMLSLNRAIAQTVLVAMNAQAINTPEANTHAQQVADGARAVSTQIRNLLHNTGTLNGDFNSTAQSNNTKMWQGNPVTLVGNINSSFMRSGFSTNVYFTPQFSGSLGDPNVLNTQPNANTSNATGDNFMAGYVEFNLPSGAGGTVNIAGVPIFPQTQPHLCDGSEFDANTGEPVGGSYVPPNAFKANSEALDGHSGNFGSSVASALVGCLDSEFPASIPRGYVRIVNGDPLPAGQIPTNPVVDGTDDIFNNELWPPSSISSGMTDGGQNIFSTDGNKMQQWADYNNGDGVTPARPADTAGMYFNTGGNAVGVNPNDIDGFATPPGDPYKGGATACDALNYWGNTNCFGQNLAAAAASPAAYNRQPQTGNLNGSDVTAVEAYKAKLLQDRAGGGECVHIDASTPNDVSGMKKFNVGQCFPTNPEPILFGQVGSALDYIQQIESGANCSIIQMITDRLKQADETVSNAAVQNCLGTYPLPMGASYAIYVSGPGQCSMAQIQPGSNYFEFPSTAVGSPGYNDGTNAAPSVKQTCQNTYPLGQKIVNASTKGGCSGHGDAGYHEAPFVNSSGDLAGIDRAVFTPASGWNNILGDCTFENTAEGAGSFCKPN